LAWREGAEGREVISEEGRIRGKRGNRRGGEDQDEERE
jgi:hypothetical protein